MLTITSAKIRFASFFALVALASTTANAQLVRGPMSLDDLGTTSLHATNKFKIGIADAKTTSSFSMKAAILSQNLTVPGIQESKASPIVDGMDITGVAFADLKAIKDLPLVAPKKRFKFSSL